MALLDFLKNRNASQQQAPVAQTPQQSAPRPEPIRPVENLPADVKANAVEAARPAAQLMDKATKPSSAPVQPQATPNAIARGRSLSMER